MGGGGGGGGLGRGRGGGGGEGGEGRRMPDEMSASGHLEKIDIQVP